MQHRRIPADDFKGIDEYVNEVDANGFGYRVPASYFVQIFTEGKRESMQRMIQMKTDDPARYFFNFDVKPRSMPALKSVDNLSNDLKEAGIQGHVKIVT